MGALEERIVDVLAGKPLRAISYGGGVQSNALLVLAAQGVIDYPIALWSNVGEDSEHPDTIAYVRDVAMPYAAANGVELHELRRTYVRTGEPYQTIFQAEMNQDRKWFNIPFRGAEGQPLKRQCTDSWKIQVVGRWLRSAGASKVLPADVAIGFSVDELERAKTPDGAIDHRNPEQRKRYPLLDLGLRRGDCTRIIQDAGLPVPPKSSCYFCPFSSNERWIELKRKDPDLFAKAVEMEAVANWKLEQRGRGDRPVFLTRFGRPLDEVFEEEQMDLFGDGPEGCDDGYCWT